MPPGPSPFHIPDTVLVREMQGESVLLDLATETYFGLDDVGTRMWAALTSSASMDAACDLLVKEYDVDRPRVEADLREFAGKLAAAGLLSVA
ncbi:PqqD family protein [Caenimonas sp. DR4.4]|uniref:PqqD family protein n=2 Tax=Caenimonas aquaedulcis TaxID=2793270 RepID=A0A931H5L0_9BURK|nr:PqqD family protein [Caenimonas aquaedulcis]